MHCRWSLTLLMLCFSAPAAPWREASAQQPERRYSPQEIADFVVRNCSDESRSIFELEPAEPVIASTISNDGLVVGYLTAQTLHLVDLRNGNRRKIDVELAPTGIGPPSGPAGEFTGPADLRLIGQLAAIWTPSKLMVVSIEKQSVILTITPSGGEQRFINWTTSPTGSRVLLVGNHGARYVANMAHGSAFAEKFAEPKARDKSSQAISDDGLRLLILIDPLELLVSNQDLSPPNHVGTFRGDEFYPGITKLAASDRHIAVVGKDMLNIMPMPQNSEQSVQPFAMSGDFVCLFAQMGVKPDGDHLFGALRTQLNDDLFMFALNLKTASVARLWKLPENDPHFIRWSLTGDRVCYSTPSKIVVMEPSALARGAGEQALKPIAGPLIEERDFAALDQVASLLVDVDGSPLRPYDRWYGHLSVRLLNNYQNDDLAPEFVRHWLEERPSSELARLLIADWNRAKGWAIRGSGFVSTVSEDRLQQFHDHLMDAYRILGDIEARNVPRNTIATALEISKALGPDAFDRQTLVDKLCEKFPDYVDGHARVVEMLMPRWGGSAEGVKTYIEQVADLQPEGEADRMYASLALRLMPYFQSEQLFEAFDLDLDRVVRGAKQMDLGVGRQSESYRVLMRLMVERERIRDAYELLKNHTKSNPFITQTYKHKRTAAIMRRKFLELEDIGREDIQAATRAASKSLSRRTDPQAGVD